MSYRPVTPYAYSIQNHYIISKLMQKVYWWQKFDA
jgi:hypothetical protein